MLLAIDQQNRGPLYIHGRHRFIKDCLEVALKVKSCIEGLRHFKQRSRQVKLLLGHADLNFVLLSLLFLLKLLFAKTDDFLVPCAENAVEL
ncbi:MAG: hypothetical protein ACD_39C00013G0003 [uncultured bacterium]|nr:MAG: hypothetical protein ACD_39C00013G0003 [uncultured bacterium]